MPTTRFTPVLVVAGLMCGLPMPCAAEITFNRDIAPIIFANCSECHRPSHAAPFSLLTFDDVRKRARQIVEVTGSGFMPPWVPEPSADGIHLVGERRLNASQIDLIRQWVEGGTIEGNPIDLPPAPQFTDGWLLGEPDLVLTLPEPFVVPADTRDTIRTFVIPVSLPAAQVVRAIDFNAGNPRAVHHASFLVDTSGSARMIDEHEPGPGYRGMGDIGFTLAGSFGTWAPAATPRFWPTGVGREMPKEFDLVFEVHFNPTGKPEDVQPRIALYFEKEQINHQTVAMSLGSFFLDIPAGEKNYVITDSMTLPTDAQLLAIAPHAHYICRTVNATATLPDGRCIKLLTITDWDFNWQQEYRFREPIALPAGTVIDLKVRYDNSAENQRNPFNPPRRVRIGPNASDEMALAFLTMTATDENARPLLERMHQDMLMKRMREAQINRRQVNESPASSPVQE